MLVRRIKEPHRPRRVSQASNHLDCQTEHLVEAMRTGTIAGNRMAVGMVRLHRVNTMQECNRTMDHRLDRRLLTLCLAEVEEEGGIKMVLVVPRHRLGTCIRPVAVVVLVPRTSSIRSIKGRTVSRSSNSNITITSSNINSSKDIITLRRRRLTMQGGLAEAEVRGENAEMGRSCFMYESTECECKVCTNMYSSGCDPGRVTFGVVLDAVFEFASSSSSTCCAGRENRCVRVSG